MTSYIVHNCEAFLQCGNSNAGSGHLVFRMIEDTFQEFQLQHQIGEQQNPAEVFDCGEFKMMVLKKC